MFAAENIPLIILAGPTGVGKTHVAIELAEQLNGEIIGADSMQIYRYMDIGTAKPTVEEQARIPHHLINIRNPDEEYSAADYVRDAARTIRAIYEQGKMPLLVGGTGMYIDKLLYGIFEGPGRDDVFRQEMRTLAEQEGSLTLYQKLQQVDPVTAKRLHPNDLVRIIRALEVFHLTGTPISTYQTKATVPVAQYDSCFLVLTADRESLYARINARVEQMIEVGLVDEVQELYKRGYHRKLRPMQSLGYKEIGEFLAGEYDLPSTVALIQRNTRRYAKRQLTWFRKHAAVSWVTRDMNEDDDETVEKCLHIVRQHRQPSIIPD